MQATGCRGPSAVFRIAIMCLPCARRPARFFLLAWGVLLVFIVLGALRNFALVPSNVWSMNGLHLGVAFDVLLLSFGRGDRINLLRRERAAAQAALLDNAKLHERELSARVEERTAQLEETNRKLRAEALAHHGARGRYGGAPWRRRICGAEQQPA